VGAHYLDITGEIDVFEALYARDQEAKDERVVLLPGAGFDVVPTDCVAACLAEAMPDAVSLELAFMAEVKLGPGTIKTAIEGAGQGGRARVDGRLVAVPVGHRRVEAAFPSGTRKATSIPWGDLASAYRSTGIPNITTYAVVPFGGLLRYGQAVTKPVLGLPVAQRLAKRAVDRFVPRGVEMDEPGRSQVWGRVRNAGGHELTMTLDAPNGLPFTADAVVTIATRLHRDGVQPGAHTPSTAFGPRFAGELADVKLGDPV
jgi:saccharopine dehydrogenase (NAD+, L-lysine-forming)